MTDILLTGLPRSGTTLLCSLLNQLPDTVALAEPMRMTFGTVGALVEGVDAFISATRRDVGLKGTATTKLVGGAFPDNFAAPAGRPGGLREILATTGEMRIAKPLSDDFRLYIKHNAAFTFSATALATRYPLFALVRDPLAVLASWQTVDLPVHDGRLPAAERIRPDLRAHLGSIPDRLTRQVEIIRLILEIYAEMPRQQVLRYEDLIADPARTLTPLHPRPAGLIPHAKAQPASERYPGVDLEQLSQALQPLAGLIARFYP